MADIPRWYTIQSGDSIPQKRGRSSTQQTKAPILILLERV
jgi:hypothetical protein